MGHLFFPGLRHNILEADRCAERVPRVESLFWFLSTYCAPRALGDGCRVPTSFLDGASASCCVSAPHLMSRAPNKREHPRSYVTSPHALPPSCGSFESP